MASIVNRKHFLPLESNPEVFNDLIARLGALPNLAFEDVFSLDDPDLLPSDPALALVLVFPTTAGYEALKAEEERGRDEYSGRGDAEPVVWFKQTINNACGLYAVLHALCNGEARGLIRNRAPQSSCFILRWGLAG